MKEFNTFSSDPFNVTFFPESETSTTHNVTIVPDDLYEGSETFYLEITHIYAESSLQGLLRIGRPSPVRVIILDNDGESAAVLLGLTTSIQPSVPYPLLIHAVLEVRFSQMNLDVEEGQIAVLQGEIHNESNPFQRPLTVGVICFESQTSSFGITPGVCAVPCVMLTAPCLTVPACVLLQQWKMLTLKLEGDILCHSPMWELVPVLELSLPLMLK